MHPMQRDCDIDDPKEFAAWVFAAGLPDVGVRTGNRIPNLISPQLVEGVSEMLWEFGFRHHPDLQEKWIEGGSGLGTIARIVDHEPEDWVAKAGEKFLEETNPKLLEAINSASPEQKNKLYNELEKNFEELKRLMSLLEDNKDD